MNENPTPEEVSVANRINERRELIRLRAQQTVLVEAMADITKQWPAAFDALAPSFRHMTSGDQVATVNNFDQAVIRGSKALATLDVPDTKEG